VGFGTGIFSRCAAKTELCATVFRFLELRFLSIPKSSRHIAADDQLIHPRDLAVDLLRQQRESNSLNRYIVIRKNSEFTNYEFTNYGSPRFALLLRKEVIQPQVPLRLPCYDFIPVTAHSVGHYFPCGLVRVLRLQVTSMM
jgi:hypothetical protein